MLCGAMCNTLRTLLCLLPRLLLTDASLQGAILGPQRAKVHGGRGSHQTRGGLTPFLLCQGDAARVALGDGVLQPTPLLMYHLLDIVGPPQ